MVKYMKIHQCTPSYKQTEEKKHRIISLDAEIAFVKIEKSFMSKILDISRIQGKHLNTIQVIYSKLIVNIKLKMERNLKHFY